MNDEPIRIRWLDQIESVEPRQWNRLAEPLETPFLEWEWLWLMEASGSTGPQAGWIPRHLTLWRGRELIGAAPLYIKVHSAGEFVFDHAWAEVAGRMRIAYYPKLVGMSPFTPMIGYRFLTAPELAVEDITALMLREIQGFSEKTGLSGCSFLFADPPWAQQVQDLGFCPWVHQSFAWENKGYSRFEDYLGEFKANQRRNIRRERRGLARRGIRIQMVPGSQLPREYLAWMYAFYARTNDKFGPWGCKYLTRKFFGELSEHFRHRLVFAVAIEDGKPEMPVGMSLLVTKRDQLYGRYWGSASDIEYLHFNACYYEPIAWAIEQGIRRYDPGAGGGHKLRRGFSAVANISLHRFTDPRMRQVMERHIEAINRLEREEIAAANQELPWRQPSPTA
ncbi:MAG TPA: GNAT family N-acetyltransferase [Desulfobacterales bacterium]|nr:GNAT family N-acetyltransferase [Desulfobacterales bacterium]